MSMNADRPAAAAAGVADVPETKWPESTPSDDEGHIVSVVCGNSHLHWAFHNGVEENLAPSLFWRTPHLLEEDLGGPTAEALSRHLPQFAHDYIFGDVTSSTEEDAIKKSKERKVEQLSVYLISTNSDQIALLSQMWRSVPCRIYRLKGDDFFSKKQGRYDSMGVDRMATLLGAADIHGYPSLVFDGGTAITYTAADSSGNIMGGGIGPGLQLKLRSLGEYTDALPLIGPDEVIKRVEAAANNKAPLPTFANNTKEAIMVEVLSEMAHSGRNVIKKWLKTMSAKVPNKNLAENKERAVIVTGGDGEILAQLFQSDHGTIIEADKTSPSLESHEILHAKHLVHYGIQAALMKQVKVCRKGKLMADKKELQGLIGKRVAKRFDSPDADGEFMYRGEVSVVDQAKDDDGSDDMVFTITYDDGDKEDVDYYELQLMLSQYEEVGEKDASKPKEKSAKSKSAKIPPGKAGNSSSQKRGKKRDAPASEGPKPAMPVPKAKRTKQTLIIGDQNKYVGTRIGKLFEKDLYFGTIDKYRFDDEDNEDLWHVAYDDGDQEEIDAKELKRALKVYEKEQEKDDSPVTKKNKLEFASAETKTESAKANASQDDEIEQPQTQNAAPKADETTAGLSEKQPPGESGKETETLNGTTGAAQPEVSGKEESHATEEDGKVPANSDEEVRKDAA